MHQTVHQLHKFRVGALRQCCGNVRPGGVPEALFDLGEPYRQFRLPGRLGAEAFEGVVKRFGDDGVHEFAEVFGGYVVRGQATPEHVGGTESPAGE